MQTVETLGGIITVASLLMLCGCGVEEREVVAGRAKTPSTKTSRTATSKAVPRYTITDLGTLGGKGTAHFATIPFGINNKGQVVGRSATIGGSAIAGGKVGLFLWDKRKMQDLGVREDGKYRWSDALDIDDRGQVVVRVQRMDESYRSFLWEKGALQELAMLLLPQPRP